MNIPLYKFIAYEQGLLSDFFSAHIANNTENRTKEEWNKLLIEFKKYKQKIAGKYSHD